MTKIAFDIDETLITMDVNGRSTPNYEVINIFRFFQKHGCHMIVWSGCGKAYAEEWNSKLGLGADECLMKDKFKHVDIVFDDQEVLLGRVNVLV